ncbi:aldose 1-epimerase [Georgenia alba]|uniref:Aldose 1-epimerase n=1 Tax=Georgenia alba TaxID=2233858 RepID=A0ABW2QFG1_9MICO
MENDDDATTWHLAHPSGSSLRLAATGATLLSWQVPGPDGPHDLLDGYTSAAELAERDGYRNAVLAPWSNRIRDSRYTFQGEVHDVGPGETGIRDGLHGLVTRQVFERVAGTDGAITVRTSITPDTGPGYPFAVDLEVTYRLTAGPAGEQALTVEMDATNVGDGPAPVGLGWHPYFRLPGHPSIDELELTIPARTRVLTDAGIIPLPGDEAFEPVQPPGDVGLSPIGATVLDQAFTDLLPGPDGTVASVLRSPRTGDTLTLWQQAAEARIVHVFTGDLLARDRRASVAVEPCSFGGDALNRETEAMVLQPGGRRHLRADVVYERG